MSNLIVRMCELCKIRPARLRRGIDPQNAPGIIYCMECAEKEMVLGREDYNPEPEGFAEFAALVINGAFA